MRCVRLAILATLPSLALFTTSAYANSCWYPNESKAAQLRDFHTMLMVGTLQCRSDNRWAVERYNEFVTKQRGLLDANAYVLKAHFMRENGIQDGQAAYDRFATTLANQKGARTSDPGFCQTIDTFVRMATDATQADLLVLAASVSDAPVSGACAPSNYVADASPVGGKEANAPDTATPDTAAAAAPYPTAKAELPVTTAAAPVTDADTKTVAKAAEPSEVKAVAQQSTTDQAATTPATTATTRDEALKAAIVALQSATAALQAATASSGPAETSAAKKPQSNMVKVVDAPVVPPQEETTKQDE